jgi:hypothetical protein
VAAVRRLVDRPQGKSGAPEGALRTATIKLHVTMRLVPSERLNPITMSSDGAQTSHRFQQAQGGTDCLGNVLQLKAKRLAGLLKTRKKGDFLLIGCDRVLTAYSMSNTVYKHSI